jgi:type IV pilus assembly protein PilM
MLFGSKSVLAIDIGSSSIKACELEVSKSSAKLISFGFVSTPPQAVQSGEIMNPEMIASVIKNLVKDIKTKRKSVATSLSGNGLIVKKISIPKVAKKLIPETIKWEAEQYIPFDISTVNLGYHQLSSLMPDTMDVLISAAQLEIIEKYSQSIKAAGLQPAVVDVGSFALANLYEFNYGLAPNECVGLLNIGSQISNMVILQGGQVVFARDIAVGGNQYTVEIQKELGVTLQEAESLKVSASQKGEAPAQAQEVIRHVNESFSEEIRNNFDFFSGGNTGIPVSKVFYSGGGSLSPGLINQASIALGVEFEPFNPFLSIQGSKQITSDYMNQIAPFAAIALGLGLRKAGDS